MKKARTFLTFFHVFVLVSGFAMRFIEKHAYI